MDVFNPGRTPVQATQDGRIAPPYETTTVPDRDPVAARLVAAGVLTKLAATSGTPTTTTPKGAEKGTD